MPYKREKASKGGHSDLVKNPDIQNFLNDCEYMREPTDEEANTIASSYLSAPSSATLPIKVVASDASPYSEPIAGKFPSTQVGYVKVSLVLIDVNDYDGLTQPGSRYVDPFKVAAMHRNADAFSFTLPGSNVRYKNAKTVSDGFRKAMWEQLSDERTKLAKDEGFSVNGTLLDINNGEVEVKKCSSCSLEQIFLFTNRTQIHNCPHCNSEIYMTDCLRIHEQITDYGDCSAAITRFMNVAEHLILATFIRMLAHYQPKTLSKMAFIVDGPLAIFGQPASVHARLMSLYYRISTDLNNQGLLPPIIIGLQKDGQVMEHARALSRFLPNNVYRVVDDEYRAEHISPSISDNFGHETYYGQDYIFKTNSGRVFTVGIPYPFENKKNRSIFAKEKSNLSNYGNLIARSFDLIRHFEFDLYDNAVVPIALAHRHASISLIPGGKVLDLVTRHGLIK
ncbi:MAG: hypothetical protein SFU55_11745 [Methylophilus sp.]|nr:hypothetical protein [Methylophilus sp.]